MKFPKIGKRSWMVVILGCVIIGAGSLSVNLYQQSRHYNNMRELYLNTTENLDSVQLSKLRENRTKLESELSTVTNELREAQMKFNTVVESSMITKTLFDIAQNHGLEVFAMTSSVPSLETLNGVELSRTVLSARLEGEYQELVKFIIDIDHHFPTGVVQSVNIVVPDDTSGEIPSADFAMNIYTAKR